MSTYIGLLMFLFTYGGIVICAIQTKNVFLIAVSTIFFILGMIFNIRSIIKKKRGKKK